LLISKDEALALYEGQKISINAIASAREVHPNTIRRNLLNLGFTTRSQKQRPNAFSYDSQAHEGLEALALGIWMGEGTKKGKRVEVTNCDLCILRVWLSFLIKVCRADVNKLWLRIALHDAKLKAEAVKYWREVLGMNLTLYFSIKALKANASVKQPIGTATLGFNSKFLLERIQHRAVELATSLK